MKKIIRNFIIISFLLCSPVFMSNVFADLPPDPGGGPGGGDLPVGGGSPIGSGVVVLLTLGVAYGGRKVFNARKKILD